MKYLSTQVLTLAGLLATAGGALAQDFRPFRAGLTYQYSETATPGDTTHTLRLQAGTRAGADSVFRFNTMAGSVPRNGNSCGANYLLRRDNLFGATLTVAGNGSFVLAAANGRALTLRPRAAAGQPWAAMPGVTGTVQSRGVAPVLGQMDSVVTIALSSGPTLLLSKRHGLVQGPAVIALLNGHYRARQLTLTALPERGVGRRISMSTVYDFQPGDVFLRHYVSPCQVEWQRDSVISRSSNAAGDSITYAIRTRRLTRGWGYLCNAPYSTSLSAPATYSLVVSVSGGMPYGLSALSNAFEPGAATINQYLTLAAARSTRYNGRFVQSALNRRPCGPLAADSVGLSDVIDHFYMTTYGQGLGMTSILAYNYGEPSTMELVGYRKGSETWGQLRTFAQLLPTARPRAAATTIASPNPFSQELTVSFELSRPQAVALELRDALGRAVLARPATQLPAGARQLTIGTAGLAPGVYTLWLQPAGSPAQVLKVLKAE